MKEIQFILKEKKNKLREGEVTCGLWLHDHCNVCITLPRDGAALIFWDFWDFFGIWNSRLAFNLL